TATGVVDAYARVLTDWRPWLEIQQVNLVRRRHTRHDSVLEFPLFTPDGTEDAPGDDDITLNEERRELLAVVANDGAHRDVFGCPRVGEHDRHLRVLWWLTDHPQPTSASQHRALRNIEHLCDVGWGGHPRHSHD